MVNALVAHGDDDALTDGDLSVNRYATLALCNQFFVRSWLVNKACTLALRECLRNSYQDTCLTSRTTDVPYTVEMTEN